MIKYDTKFDHAVFARSNVTFDGNNYVDSYNSSVKLIWSVASRLLHGDIGTNATGNGSVLLNGSTHIYGEADIGPGGNPITPHGTVTENGVATIDGGVSVLPSPKDMTPVTNPGGGTNTNLTNINGSNTTVTITSGSTTWKYNCERFQ